MTMTTMLTTVISMTLSAKSSALHSRSHLLFDLDLAFGAIDSNLDNVRLYILSPSSPLPPPLPSASISAAAGEPF